MWFINDSAIDVVLSLDISQAVFSLPWRTVREGLFANVATGKTVHDSGRVSRDDIVSFERFSEMLLALL
jgi:hypothetical protein